ncbi:MAG: DUF5667 domain-containing protein [Candidatus Falkowbacteria bacterium]
MDTVLRQLKDLRNVKPRAEWVKNTRGVLLSQIRAQAVAKEVKTDVRYFDLFKVVFGYKILAPIVRPVGVVVLALIFVLTGGVLGVRAAKQSAPGDVLYSVKLTSENLQVSLTGSAEAKTKLYLSFAEERMKEIEQTKAGGSRAKNIASAAANLKEKIQKVNEQLTVVKTNNPEKAVELAKIVNTKVEEIGAKLREAEKTLVNESGSGLNDAAVAARDAGVKAVEVIIEKQSAGETKVGASELKDIVENKLNNVE